jgi:ParB family chromosome partitioning protein
LRTNELVGADSGESREQVRRYIRLTHLNKQLLDMVDEGRIAFTPAVELSYLNEIEQQDLVEAISECDATPNLSQACRFKKMSTEGQGLTPESITEILNEKKANQKPMFKIHYEKLQTVAPQIKESDFEAFVLEACQRHYKFLQKQKMKDER